MTTLTPLVAGQYAVVMHEHYYRGDVSLAYQVATIPSAPSGWNSSEMIVVRHVGRVMPKTYRCQSADKSRHRYAVIAAFDTEAEARALRTLILSIANRADQEIENEVSKATDLIEERILSAALKEMQVAMPDLLSDESQHIRCHY